MDSDENLEELATELFGKGKGWGPLHIAAGTALMGYFAWVGALMFGLRKVSVQVPYVPSSAKQIKNIMLLLKGRSGKLVDLGSGDGRIADLSDCINVTVFLAPSVVPPLERKLLAELPDEACVVTARFPFFKWAPSSVAGDGLERARPTTSRLYGKQNRRNQEDIVSKRQTRFQSRTVQKRWMGMCETAALLLLHKNIRRAPLDQAKAHLVQLPVSQWPTKCFGNTQDDKRPASVAQRMASPTATALVRAPFAY